MSDEELTGTLYCHGCDIHHAVSDQIDKYEDTDEWKCDVCGVKFFTDKEVSDE